MKCVNGCSGDAGERIFRELGNGRNRRVGVDGEGRGVRRPPQTQRLRARAGRVGGGPRTARRHRRMRPARGSARPQVASRRPQGGMGAVRRPLRGVLAGAGPGPPATRRRARGVPVADPARSLAEPPCAAPGRTGGAGPPSRRARPRRRRGPGNGPPSWPPGARPSRGPTSATSPTPRSLAKRNGSRPGSPAPCAIGSRGATGTRPGRRASISAGPCGATSAGAASPSISFAAGAGTGPSASSSSSTSRARWSRTAASFSNS